MLLPTTTGRKDGSALKSPTASSEVIPILPGSTDPRSSGPERRKASPGFCEHIECLLPSADDRIPPAGHRGAILPTATDGLLPKHARTEGCTIIGKQRQL